MFFRFSLIIYLLFILNCNGFSKFIVFDENLIEKNITPHLSCCLDENGTQFKIYNRDMINLGYMPERGIWCQFSLKNETNATKKIILEYADQYLRH